MAWLGGVIWVGMAWGCDLGGMAWGCDLGGMAWGCGLDGMAWGCDLGGMAWGCGLGGMVSWLNFRPQIIFHEILIVHLECL